MGQSANCCKQQTDNISDEQSEQINSEYFGPHYASQYSIKTKFITDFEACINNIQELRKPSQTVSSTNHTDQEVVLNSIQQNEKFLTNTNQILDSLFDLDSHNLNSSYDNNSINGHRSILKKKDLKTFKPPKSVKFNNPDQKKKMNKTQQKQLGELLKRKRN
ncbi:unnamed protein product [Paramecium sonneborni]|uniref:Uncharacterized protein n=1 Tax=Paramecium sonneborni TaxID=65129 RepID=A0A8S1MA81_9CILI|nr:unnamed protein product [Paramecium sonneborni]